MKKAGQKKTSFNSKRISCANKIPTRKYLMEAPSTVGMNYQSANSNTKTTYGMVKENNLHPSDRTQYLMSIILLLLLNCI